MEKRSECKIVGYEIKNGQIVVKTEGTLEVIVWPANVLNENK